MGKLMTLAAYAALVLFVSGCGTFERDKNAINEEAKSTNFDKNYKPSEHYGEIGLPINSKVQKWLNYFTGRGRRHMARYLNRSSRYIPMMKGVFRERGMPEELAYIAMIESGFSATALSHASAVGYWQFIRGTGKRYNLKINSYVDERRDPILSTQAAANYLDALYNLFNDWYLAMGAYNAGENRIQRAVMRKRSRDFWKLASYRSRRVLPPETRNYVPKFIAATLIAKDPAKYGFTNLDFAPAFSYDTVVIDKSISLVKLGKELKVPYKELKRLNPRYKSDYVPIYKDRRNAVRVPVGMKDLAVASLNNTYTSAPTVYVDSFQYYRVRRGDTLGGIARKFGTRMSRIRELNNMGRRRTMIRLGQKLKVPDGPTRRYSKKKRRSVAKNQGPGKYHVVRKGETLSEIAERYGVGLSKVRSWNGLGRRSMIRIGQRIRVSAPNQSVKTKKTKDGVHVVRRGDTLSGVAQKYDVSMSKLKQWNNLSRKSTIKVGQRLKLRAPASAAKKASSKFHVVRRGENLSLIAKKYRVSIREIAQANNMGRKSTLFAGKKLKIPAN